MYVFICIVIRAFSFLFLHKKKKLFENHTNQSNFEICPILLYIVYIYIAVLTVLGTTFKPLRFCQPLKLCYNAHASVCPSIYIYRIPVIFRCFHHRRHVIQVSGVVSRCIVLYIM